MKKSLLFLISTVFLASSTFAQEKAEIKMKVVKDGEVVKDTSYVFDDIKKAKHAVQMMDMISSKDMDEIHSKMMDDDHGHKKHMVFISEDGKVHESKGNEMKWVSEDGDSIKKYKVMMSDGHAGHSNVHFFSDEDSEENVFVHGEDGTVEVIVKKIIKSEGSEDHIVKKEIIVIGDDEDGEWNVEEGEDGQIIMKSADGKTVKKIKIKSDGDEDFKVWTNKEGDVDEDVKVYVIKKEKGEKGEKMEIEVSIDDSEKDVKEKKGKKKKEK